MRKILVTGSSGFIGSNFIKHWLGQHPTDNIIAFDSETYAARRPLIQDDQIFRIRGCVTDQALLQRVLEEYRPDMMFHMAAESHVCNSIKGPVEFFKSNAMGTFTVLEAWRQYDPTKRLVYVSTDEVFGELEMDDLPWIEESPVMPRSPYAASKAAGDMMAQAYFHTYGMNVCITNSSNNFGPNQHEEKLIPKTIYKLMTGKPMTLNGTGKNVRDWIFVTDHCRALETVAFCGEAGERYLIGGECELTNMNVVHLIHQTMKQLDPSNIGELEIEWTNDRPTDDRRYSMMTDKMRSIGWRPQPQALDAYLFDTCEWYIMNGFGGRK